MKKLIVILVVLFVLGYFMIDIKFIPNESQIAAVENRQSEVIPVTPTVTPIPPQPELTPTPTSIIPESPTPTPYLTESESKIESGEEPSDSWDEIFSRTVKSVVLVECYPEFGAGFVVGNGEYVITNEHVCDGRSKTRVIFINKETVGHEIDVWYERDLKLIQLEEAGPPFELSNDEVMSGQEVATYGSPRGLNLSINPTYVLWLGVTSTDERGLTMDKLIELDKLAPQGSSGGPVLDKKGQVVGVVVRQSLPTSTLAIPVDFVKDLLNRNSISY